MDVKEKGRNPLEFKPLILIAEYVESIGNNENRDLNVFYKYSSIPGLNRNRIYEKTQDG